MIDEAGTTRLVARVVLSALIAVTAAVAAGDPASPSRTTVTVACTVERLIVAKIAVGSTPGKRRAMVAVLTEGVGMTAVEEVLSTRLISKLAATVCRRRI